MTVIVKFGHKLNFPNGTRHDPSRFPGGVWKSMGATFIIFQKGVVVIVGIRCIPHLESMLVPLVQHFGQYESYEIKNMVGSRRYSQKIELDELFEKLSKNYLTIYEPELFCALRVYVDGALATIFHNGKVYVTGARSMEQLESTFGILNKILH